MPTIDKVLYVNSDRVIIYLENRQFEVVTNKGEAVKLTKELLFPYFERLRLRQEEDTVVVPLPKAAA